ncbi:hypothetical protein CK934_05710 [Chitinophaga sp. MD30]|nr:hypothetical protein CK934_05710 [Chitinophaga sp. MD30]
MTISEHINSLQRHLAQLGLYQVPVGGAESEVFKVCFLNKYEMQQWQRLREEQSVNKAAGSQTEGRDRYNSRDSK